MINSKQKLAISNWNEFIITS